VYRAATRNLERIVPDDLRGFPLGVEPDPGCGTVTVALAPGDSVLFYSDGILDAGQSKGQRFGWDSLRATVESAPATLTADQIGERIINAVAAHAADAEQFDDISLVVFGRV
jgi:sigma-B regulation protein RsbU (phosphoserine phosphatase)